MTTCSDCPSEAFLWIKEAETVDSLEECKSARSIAGKDFPKFRNAGREDCFFFGQDRPEFSLQEEGHWRTGLRNFDARHEKIETGAVVNNGKGLSGVERGRGFCYQWKEKGQCSNGD